MEFMKKKFVHFYLTVAQCASHMSYANRLKVGCVIVKNDNIISHSWNGTPAGWDNTCEDELGHTKSEVSHAEENAIIKLAKSHEAGEGAIMFCTHAPCINCARLIYGSGIKELYYLEKYRDDTGLDFLKKLGIKIKKVTLK
jgi:dCMP deaminase